MSNSTRTPIDRMLRLVADVRPGEGLTAVLLVPQRLPSSHRVLHAQALREAL